MTKSKPTIDSLLAKKDWHAERKAIREIALASGLTEEVKWAKICFTFDNSNVAIFYGMKKYCGLGFFKGALLKDPDRLLHRQGEHSQAVRLFRFTSASEIAASEPALRAFISEAIEVEKSGLKIDFKEKHELVFPDELVNRLDADPEFATAFHALTPGRQRGYNLHFSSAKQSATRTARIEKHADRILAGKGMHDR